MRPATPSDPGFQQGQDQIVIVLENGEQKTIKRSEVTGPPQQQK